MQGFLNLFDHLPNARRHRAIRIQPQVLLILVQRPLRVAFPEHHIAEQGVHGSQVWHSGYRFAGVGRGILPAAAALSMILAIFCATGAESWFARDKTGLDSGLISSSAIGLLVIGLLLLQVVVVAVCLYAFNQNWHVEEERPIGSGEDYGAGASPEDGAPLPA